MRSKKILTALILLVLYFSTGQITFAQKNAPPENWRSFILNLYFDGVNLYADPGFPNPIDITITSPQSIKPGEFKIEIYSPKNAILFTAIYQPDFGSNILYVPYYLNAAKIKITNSLNEINSINTQGLAVCNENNICELGEENLCSIDCKSADNPAYPLTPAGKISEFQKPQPLESPATTPTPEFAKNQFRGYLIFLGVGVGFLLILFGVLYWYNKRKVN